LNSSRRASLPPMPDHPEITGSAVARRTPMQRRGECGRRRSTYVPIPALCIQLVAIACPCVPVGDSRLRNCFSAGDRWRPQLNGKQQPVPPALLPPILGRGSVSETLCFLYDPNGMLREFELSLIYLFKTIPAGLLVGKIAATHLY